MAAPETDATLASIRLEVPGDELSVERVVARAFGPGRLAKTSERIREIAALRRDLSQVVRLGSEIVGCCRIWSFHVGGTPALFLGPLAVEPDLQDDGLGKALTDAALTACRSEALPIILVGRPSFFARFGFLPATWAPVEVPGPLERKRLMWRPSSAGDPPPSGRLTGPP